MSEKSRETIGFISARSIGVAAEIAIDSTKVIASAGRSVLVDATATVRVASLRKAQPMHPCALMDARENSTVHSSTLEGTRYACVRVAVQVHGAVIRPFTYHYPCRCLVPG